MDQQSKTPIWLKAVAIFAIIFGAISLFKAGGVLFGPQSVVDAAGNFVPFVVKFNFIAGGLYILAGIGIFLGRSWALALSALIALGTAITAAALARHTMAGGAFEMKTVGAMGIRFGFWFIVTLVLWRGKNRS